MTPQVPTPEKPRIPRCPHCSARPCELYLQEAAFGPVPVAVFCCKKCDRIISVALIPLMPQQRSSQQRSGLILPPN